MKSSTSQTRRPDRADIHSTVHKIKIDSEAIRIVGGNDIVQAAIAAKQT